MRICYIISDIDKAVFFENTLLELRNAEFNCFVILINSAGGSLHHFLIENNFDFELLENKKISRSLSAILKCRKILKKFQPELIHCHLAHANWIGLVGGFLAGIKTRVFTRHSGELLAINWKEKYIDIIQNKLATKIISISLVIDDLLEKQGVPKSKRVLVHHGFDLERFLHPDPIEVDRIKKEYNPNDTHPTIGVLARWMEFKGLQYIIPAFKKFIQKEPNAHLLLFGATVEVEYSKVILELLKDIPKENYTIVKFEKNIFDLYQLFDIYVHVPINPYCEAFGQTYIEALAAGIPSIFTKSGIATEVMIDRKNALLVPFEDSISIYNAFVELNENKILKEELILNGKKMVEQFKFENYISNLIQLYKSK